jgi:DNA-binding PadR family transcriptional regulator
MMHPMSEYIDREMLHGHLAMLVLAVLARTPLHGYRIRQVLAECSHAAVQVSLGRLYPLLASLEHRRLVRGSVVRVGERRERRIYALTAQGQARLKLLRWKWDAFAAGVQAIVAP